MNACRLGESLIHFKGTVCEERLASDEIQKALFTVNERFITCPSTIENKTVCKKFFGKKEIPTKTTTCAF
jgi:hypothetical protein